MGSDMESRGGGYRGGGQSGGMDSLTFMPPFISHPEQIPGGGIPVGAALGRMGQVMTYPPTPSSETAPQATHQSLWAETPSQAGATPTQVGVGSLLISRGPGASMSLGPQNPFVSTPLTTHNANMHIGQSPQELHENEKNEANIDFGAFQPFMRRGLGTRRAKLSAG